MLSEAKHLNVGPGRADILRPGSTGAQNDTRKWGGFGSCVLDVLFVASSVLSFSASSAAQTYSWNKSAGIQQEQAAPTPARPVALRERVKVERYEIEVSFEPEKAFLHARATVTLRALVTVSAVEFELNPNLKILEVTDAQGRKLAFDRSGRIGSPKLSVRLAEPVTASSTPPGAPTSGQAEGPAFTLTFTYEGVLPQRPLDYITKDGILLRDESRWYPAVDLSAFTENDITIHMPPSWMVRASGYSLSSPQELFSGVFRWVTGNKVSSRALVATPESLAFCDDRKTRRPFTEGVSFHAFACVAPSYAKLAEVMDDTAFDIAGFYAHLLGLRSDLAQTPAGEFHFRGINIRQGFPGQRGAIGYSAPAFLVVSEDVVKYHGYPGYAPEFLPHEIAHQWFPIEVTLAREEDGWLAEGLAEYLAWRFLQEKNPAQARLLVARAMRDSLAFEPLRPLSLGLRLFALEDPDILRATLYQRGMLVFRTLETVIDRERVDRVLREYYRRYAGRAASIADFRKVCEDVSGRDLGWFFDYFINGTQIPEIQIRRTPSVVPGEVTGEIIVANVPPEFSVRVEMRLETPGGPIDHSVATRGEVTPFTVTSTQPVTRIVLDPGQRILRWTEAARRNRSQRTLLASLGDLERAGEFARAVGICEKALALDPENLASNEQQIRFALGRLRYRMKQYVQAYQQLARVLTLGSLDPMASDFNRAWSHVYRAQIELRRGHAAAALVEARAGLAAKSPALETRVTWPENRGRETSAADELRALVH